MSIATSGVWAPGQVDLPHFVRLEPLGKKLGKVHAIARGREDGGQRRFARGAVIGVVDVLGIHPAHGRVLADDDIRFQAADDAHDLAAQLEVRLQLAIGTSHENHVTCPENARRFPLFGLSRRREPLRRHLRIVAALVSGGEQDVDDLVPLVRPAGDGPGADEFRVVRVRHHHGDLLRPRWLVARVGGIPRDLDGLGVYGRRWLARRRVWIRLAYPHRVLALVPAKPRVLPVAT